MSGVHNVGAHAFIEKVDSPDGSMIVEASVEFGVHSVASEDLHRKRRCMHCCQFWWKANFVCDVLNYLSLRYIDSYIFHMIRIHNEVILYISLVIKI